MIQNDKLVVAKYMKLPIMVTKNNQLCSYPIDDMNVSEGGGKIVSGKIEPVT